MEWCLAGGCRLGGAPGGTYGWCSPGGREDLSRPQRWSPARHMAQVTGRSGQTTPGTRESRQRGDV